LRRYRQSTGLSQTEVATRLTWSLSKMQRIEAGEVTVSGTDLRALLDLYGVSDAEEIARLLEDSRISRRERWWTKPDYRKHLPPGLLQLLQFEIEAKAIRVFQPHVIPGILQTPETAEAVLEWWKADLPEETRRVRHEVRMFRRHQTMERDDAPAYLLLLDESVIKRKVGGPAVMAGQLETLIQLIRRPNVHIRIMAMDNGGVAGSVGPFSILDLEDGGRGDAVVYREAGTQDSLLHEPAEVDWFRRTFERLWAEACSEPVTLRLIEAESAVLRSALDRM
jgi:transcriptional regulator with XRE-family HTH domain